jgi:hypothetical protein
MSDQDQETMRKEARFIGSERVGNRKMAKGND